MFSKTSTKQLFDKPLFVAILILLGIGLMMVASAGVVYGQVRFGDEYYFLKEQLVGLGVGLLFLYICQRIDYHFWQKLVVPIFFIALVLLVLVFIPGFGTTVYGAARWVEIGPIFSFINVPHINQVHILYRARLLDLDFAPGHESLEVELFEEAAIPWQEIAFRTIGMTLRHYFEDRKAGSFGFHARDLVYAQK